MTWRGFPPLATARVADASGPATTRAAMAENTGSVH
jgi:hypothetical protein